MNDIDCSKPQTGIVEIPRIPKPQFVYRPGINPAVESTETLIVDTSVLAKHFNELLLEYVRKTNDRPRYVVFGNADLKQMFGVDEWDNFVVGFVWYFNKAIRHEWMPEDEPPKMRQYAEVVQASYKRHRTSAAIWVSEFGKRAELWQYNAAIKDFTVTEE